MSEPTRPTTSRAPRADRRRVLAGLAAWFAAIAIVWSLPLSAQDLPVANRLDAIRGLLDAGRFADAEAAAADLHAKKTGERRDDPAVIDLLVRALVANGKGADTNTRTLARQAVASREAAVPAEPGALATSLRQFGDVLFERGEYRLAVEQFQRGLAVRETAREQSQIELAEDLDHLARGLMWDDRVDAAALASERALAVWSSTLGTADVRIAQSLEIRGQILQRVADYAQARRVLERAAQLRRTVAERPALATTLTLLGQQFWLEGDLIESRRASAEALAVASRTLREDHPERATYMRNLAVPVADLGDLATARELRTRALSTAERALGADHPSVGVLLNDLAVNMTQEGDYAAARVFYERALAVYGRRLGSDSTLTITVTYNLAVINATLAEYSEARYRFGQAIAAWERVFGPDHPNVARGLTAFAEMLSAQGLDAEAKPLLERALAIRERGVVRNQRDMARTLLALATSEARLGNHVRALELSSRVIASFDESTASDGRRAADALLRHGSFQAHVGNFAAAQVSFTRALALLRQLLGTYHLSVVEAQLALAEVLALERRPIEAATQSLEAEDSARNSLKLTLRYLPERQALSYGSTRPRPLDVALLTVNDIPSMAAAVLDRVVMSRSLVLDEMAGRHRDAYGTASGEVGPLWVNLMAARQRLANLVVRGPGGSRPEQYLSLVEDARADKERAERVLAEENVAFDAELHAPSIGLKEVRAALPMRAALVSFVRYQAIDRTDRGPGTTGSAKPRSYPTPTVPHYLAFVLRADGDPIPIPLGPASVVDERIARWRAEMVGWLSRPGETRQRAERTLRGIGDSVRRLVWDPVAFHLDGAERVFVVPDGALNLLPLAALPIGTTEYILERGPTIHYLSAERDLAGSRPAIRGEGVLAVGGPAFHDSSYFSTLTGPRRGTSPAQPAVARRGAPDGRSTVAGEATTRSIAECAGFQTLSFDPLPASGREANEVVALWKAFDAAGGASARALLGRAADERSVKQLGPGRRVLHLATHGFFLGSDCTPAPDGTRSVGGLVSRRKPPVKGRDVPAAAPAVTVRKDNATTAGNPLLLSGLALAGANRRSAAAGDEEDGILTAEEVASLNLAGVEWAVLSACDTGLGEIKAGEGVFGLRRAFQIAGAQTVIMSLWPVEDRAAMAWMRALYEGRLARGLDTATAVRDASVTVLRERRTRGLSTHPFYWAGFVASGDWR